MVVWWWTGYFDPGQTMNALTTPEIGNLNEPYWSNAAYDKLALEQESAVDPQQRQQLIWQMQQLMYQQSPWIPLTYVDNIEAYNTTKWTGWTREFGGSGGAFELEGNVATYLNLRPATASTASHSSSNSGLIAAIVIVVVIVVAGGAFVVLRRRAQRVEEDE